MCLLSKHKLLGINFSDYAQSLFGLHPSPSTPKQKVVILAQPNPAFTLTRLLLRSCLREGAAKNL